MNMYLQWNDTLAAHFFNAEMSGRSVHLDVNQNLISELELELEPEAGTFISAIKSGPPWAHRRGICQRALEALQDWRYRNTEFPPYVLYLGLFVLAGGADGDFSANAYYPRLRQLLDDPGEKTFPSFRYMRELWHDLEDWSIYDKGGEYGVFRARPIGGKVHIGFPLGQLLLTEQERKELPQIFYDSGLDPTSTPPADELARALRSTTAKSVLLPRTVRLVENKHDLDSYAALLDAIADELADWDGAIYTVGIDGRHSQTISAHLRICLNIDTVVGRVWASMRCKVNRDFPDEGLLLSVPGLPATYCAEEYVEGWSLPVRDSESGETLDATLLDWTRDVVMTIPSTSWRIRLDRRPVRVFIEGTREGLPGLVETRALPLGQPFYIAYSRGSWPQLVAWITNECQGFQELKNLQGLPEGWTLARIDAVLSDEAVRDAFPFLSFPPRVRLRFAGGLRSGKGNNFFDFAPPRIVVEGDIPDVGVHCNGQPLLAGAPDGSFFLPQGLPSESRIVIEARYGNSVLDRLPLFLTGEFTLLPRDGWEFFDGTGINVKPDEDYPLVAGAYVNGPLPASFNPTVGLYEDLKAELGSVKGFLVGQIPGQILQWPSKGLPDGWYPVWAIVKRKHKQWEAVFIGDSLRYASTKYLGAGDNRSRQAWKQVIWHRRKRVQPPALQSLRVLWKQFQEVARNV